VEESMPQGLKPRFVVVCNVWAKAQTYLEAKASGCNVWAKAQTYLEAKATGVMSGLKPRPT
jgi:hypothetical protein